MILYETKKLWIALALVYISICRIAVDTRRPKKTINSPPYQKVITSRRVLFTVMTSKTAEYLKISGQEINRWPWT
jgi:hypothetical protein